MSNKTTIIISNLILLLIIIRNIIVIYQNNKQLNYDKTFSSTQGFRPDYQDFIDNKDLVEELYINAPRKNYPNFVETKKEIKIMKDLKKKITLQLINEINSQKYINTYYDMFELTEDQRTLMNNSIYIHVAKDFTRKMKIEFNRVRPSYFNTNFKPVIGTPKSPSYPGGTSLLSWYIAFLLIDANLNDKEESFYNEKANIIATNREIAGVHYPSDTEYGKMLARYLFYKTKDNNPFKST